MVSGLSSVTPIFLNLNVMSQIEDDYYTESYEDMREASFRIPVLKTTRFGSIHHNQLQQNACLFVIERSMKTISLHLNIHFVLWNQIIFSQVPTNFLK